MTVLNNISTSFVELNPSDIELEGGKLNDHAYLTQLIFSNNKSGTPAQQFSLLLEMTALMEVNNPFLGGVITNLSYRYSEEVCKREFIFPEIYALKKSYDDNADLTQPAGARWFISSTNVLGTIALMKGDVGEAKAIFERGLRKYALSAHTPLLYMNLCMIYFQYGLIKYSEGRVNHAVSMFEKCYYLTVSAINEIYNVRNDWVLAMKFDCEKLIEIGAQSLVAKEIISMSSPLTGSRIPKVKARGNLQLDIVLSRFKVTDSKWHKKIERLVNSRLLGA